MEQDMERLRYPIGKFKKPDNIDKSQIEHWIKIIEEFPNRLRHKTTNLTQGELNKTYRPNGWTIMQVVHHCADSHMNSIIRFKLALTETTPTIKPYFENLWAELPDSKNFPIESSLKILDGLHARWVKLLRGLNDKDLKKDFLHPQTNERITLKECIGLYAWHCEHHLAHIINAKLS